MRFHNPRGSDRYRLTKVLNMSQVPVPHGISLEEHYCRRWPGMEALRRLAQRPVAETEPVVCAQRSHFLNDDAEFFVIAVARPLALQPDSNATVMLGFRMDRAFKRAVRFWNDEAVPPVNVNLTCERCALADCQVRAAVPTVLRAKERQAELEAALQALREEVRAR